MTWENCISMSLKSSEFMREEPQDVLIVLNVLVRQRTVHKPIFLTVLVSDIYRIHERKNVSHRTECSGNPDRKKNTIRVHRFFRIVQNNSVTNVRLTEPDVVQSILNIFSIIIIITQ